eukprot:757445_1
MMISLAVVLWMLQFCAAEDCTSDLAITETIVYTNTQPPAGVSLGSFNMGDEVRITFDFYLFRGASGAFGDETVFYIQNEDGVKPIQLNGGGSNLPLVLDFQDEGTTIGCNMGTYKRSTAYAITLVDNTL